MVLRAKWQQINSYSCRNQERLTHGRKDISIISKRNSNAVATSKGNDDNDEEDNDDDDDHITE